MGKTKIIGLDSYLKRMKRDLTDHWVNTQTFDLLDYAEKKINELGNLISSWHSRNHMDRTGNLLDSLCWGLVYRGKLCGHGFYRNKTATQPSGLHEWWNVDTAYYGKLDASSLPSSFDVYGHELAESYITKFAKRMDFNGWVLFFAILAPYWGYWEEGFTMKNKYDDSSTFVKFAAMTQFYDSVSRDLKPAKTSIKVTVVPYSNTGLFRSARRNHDRNWKATQRRIQKAKEKVSLKNKGWI